MGFLLDTDICSAHLKGNRAVAGRIEQYDGNLFVSAVTVGELFAWVLRAKTSRARSQGLSDLLGNVTFLRIDEKIARMFGEVRARQLDCGAFTPATDLLIAATSLVHELTLVTHNVEDYRHVPGLDVTDWMAT